MFKRKGKGGTGGVSTLAGTTDVDARKTDLKQVAADAKDSAKKEGKKKAGYLKRTMETKVLGSKLVRASTLSPHAPTFARMPGTGGRARKWGATVGGAGTQLLPDQCVFCRALSREACSTAKRRRSAGARWSCCSRT